MQSRKTRKENQKKKYQKTYHSLFYNLEVADYGEDSVHARETQENMQYMHSSSFAWLCVVAFIAIAAVAAFGILESGVLK